MCLNCQFFEPDVLYEHLRRMGTLEFRYLDSLKNSISIGFFQEYFSNDIEMQGKLSQLPINTKYVIYKKLSK